MRVLSLFSGAGLGDLGLTLAGMEIVGQCEIDEYCQKILALRWPGVPKWSDVKTVTGEGVYEQCGAVDLISGGFPCQPFSNAGQQKGKADDRHLWPQMFRIISEVRPTWVLGENVSGFVRIALDDVLADLESIGYETTTIIFPAHALGAPHRRERVWIVAYAGHLQRGNVGDFKEGWPKKEVRSGGNDSPCGSGEQSDYVANTKLRGRVHGQAQEQPAEGRLNAQCESFSSGSNVADTAGVHAQGRENGPGKGKSWGNGWWSVEPAVGRVAHGVPDRMDRLKALGNGQVVHCVKWLGEKIMNFEKGDT